MADIARSNINQIDISYCIKTRRMKRTKPYFTLQKAKFDFYFFIVLRSVQKFNAAEKKGPLKFGRPN